MSDLECRLRHDLNQHAAKVDVVADPPSTLLVRVRRRRRSRLLATGGTLALVTGLLAFVPAMIDDGGGITDVATGPRSSEARGLPAVPPDLKGSILANVNSQPCPGACSAARFDIRSPDNVAHVDNVGTGRLVLADGRLVARDEHTAGGSALIDPGGAPPLSLGKEVNSLDVLTDGRLVLLATNDAGQRVLRKISPRSGSIEDRPLPSRLGKAAAVTAGPDGGVAILGTEDGCCTPSALLVIGKDGKEEYYSLSFPEGRRQVLGGHLPALSWGASGLIAISGSRPQPLARAYYEGRRAPERDELHPGWTNVVDAGTGELVASLDGWQGLAWSPDGRGLLTARRDGPDTSQLAVWWGPRLKERLDVGRTSLPMVPRYWRSQ